MLNPSQLYSLHSTLYTLYHEDDKNLCIIIIWTRGDGGPRRYVEPNLSQKTIPINLIYFQSPYISFC
jgi:hypothetical protein